MGSALLIALSVLASASTLAKNELNCSLTTIVNCSHFAQQGATSAAPAPNFRYGYVGLTGNANPSLGGK